MYICKATIDFSFSRFSNKVIKNITLYHSQVENITPIFFPFISYYNADKKKTKLLNKTGKSQGYINEQI